MPRTTECASIGRITTTASGSPRPRRSRATFCRNTSSTTTTPRLCASSTCTASTGTRHKKNKKQRVRPPHQAVLCRSTDPTGRVQPGVLMVEHFTHPYFIRGRQVATRKKKDKLKRDDALFFSQHCVLLLSPSQQDLLSQIFRKTSTHSTSGRRIKMEPGLVPPFLIIKKERKKRQ
jgi:hypothetical protein